MLELATLVEDLVDAGLKSKNSLKHNTEQLTIIFQNSSGLI